MCGDRLLLEVSLYGYGYNPDLAESIRSDMTSFEGGCIVRGERLPACAPCIGVDFVVTHVGHLMTLVGEELFVVLAIEGMKKVCSYIKKWFEEHDQADERKPQVSTRIRLDKVDVTVYGASHIDDIPMYLEKACRLVNSNPIDDGAIVGVSLPTQLDHDGVYRSGRLYEHGNPDVWTVEYDKDGERLYIAYDSINELFLYGREAEECKEIA